MPPPNDNWASATVITGTSGTITGDTNVGATLEGGEPVSSCGGGGGHSIWYSWTAPFTGYLEVDSIGSSFDTCLDMFTGAGVGALTLVTFDDDSGGSGTSKLTAPVTSGTVYSIRVDGYSSGSTGTVDLHWQRAFPPVVTGLSPNPGCPLDTFILTGSGFTGASSVQTTSVFGGFVNALSFTVDSDTQITCQADGATDAGPFRVWDAGGTFHADSPALVLNPAPTVSGISPACGAEGDTIAVTGTGFHDVYQVLVGGYTSTFSIIDDSHLTLDIPNPYSGGGPGAHPQITVQTGCGSALFGDGSTTGLLIGTALSPVGGAVYDIVRVTNSLMGLTFITIDSVKVGGVSAQYVIVDDSDMDVMVPAGSGGQVEIKGHDRFRSYTYTSCKSFAIAGTGGALRWG